MASLFDEDSDDNTSITVNSSFAKKYETKKRREDLANLKTMEDSEEEEVDTDEDDDAILLTPAVERDILKTISMIKAKDEKIYKKDMEFFDDKMLTKVEKAKQLKKRQLANKQNKLTLKDYERQQLLNEGATGLIAEDYNENDSYYDDGYGNNGRPLTHVEEQRRLKQDFLASANQMLGDDTDDMLYQDKDGDLSALGLVLREKTTQELEQEEQEYQKFINEEMAKEKLDQVDEFHTLRRYWNDEELDSDEKFLRDYILDRRWIDKDDRRLRKQGYDVPKDDGEEGEESDEEYDEAVDRFEAAYNFRHEEEGGAQLMTYPRVIEDSIRQKPEKRKQARQKKKERKEAERKKKEEEMLRLKKVKQQEIMDRLKSIKEITGNDAVGLENIDLDADFDPEEYDKQMEQVFTEDYFAGGSEEDLEKPQWDDDLLDDVNFPGFEETDAELLDYQNNQGQDNEGNDDGEQQSGNGFGDWQDQQDEQTPVDQTRATQRQIRAELSGNASRNRKRKKGFDPGKYLEEYYELDYEDMIGDLPTRFKYKQVPKNDFGLSVDEILEADETDLNQYVPLKKIATYRTKEYRPQKRFNRRKKSAWKRQQEEEERQRLEMEMEMETEEQPKKKKDKKSKKEKKREKKEKEEKKKGKKRKRQEEEEQEEENKKQEDADADADGADDEEKTTKKKRRRKHRKRSKKGKKDEEEQEESKEEAQEEEAQPKKKKKRHKTAEEMDDKEHKEKREKEKKKKKRLREERERQKEQSGIEGVTKSRLNSYK